MLIKKRIKNIGKIVTGNTPPTEKREYYGDYRPFIKATDIGEGKYTYVTEESYSELAYEKYKQNIVPKGSSCVVTIGSVGKKITMAHTELFVNQAINAVIPSNSYDNEYVYYLLKYNLAQLKMLDSGTASGRENISKSSFSNIIVYVEDDIKLQRQIGRLLSTYDLAIENNNKRIKILEQMAENLYKEWFVRFRFPGHEEVEFENGIPKGWEIKNLFNVANVKYGYAFASDEFCDDKTLHPVVRIRDIQNNKTNTYTAEECDHKYIIKENDILIGMDGVFHMCLWCGGEAYLNQRVVEIESKKANDMCNYLLYFSVFPQVKFWEQTISGTTVAHLGDKHLKKMKVIIPDGPTLRKANAIVTDIMNKICSLRNCNDNLIKQRDLLLPRLMSGKLEVK